MSEVEKILAEAAEQIRKEAYFAGWNDCLAAIRAATEKVAPAASAISLGVIERESGGGDAAGAGGPKMGTTPWYVLQAVKKSPGMTGAEVVAAVLEAGHRVAEPQIRTSLSRLQARTLIVNRHRRWFPA